MIFELIGWGGAVLLLFAFVMTAALEFWKSTSKKSLIINALGSAGIVVYTGATHSWQPFSVNLPWFLFSILALCCPKFLRFVRSKILRLVHREGKT